MKKLLVFVLTICCSATYSNAEFKFKGPQIMELDKNIQGMTLSDLDGDKRTDLLLINNQEMKLECLYQRTLSELDNVIKSNIGSGYIHPVYSDLPFLRKQKLLGEFVFAVDTLDFDDDGKCDIVYVGKTKKIVVLFQTGEDKWNESWNDDESEILEYGGTLSVADLNKDGKEDLAVLTKGNVKIYFNNGDRDRPVPVSYAVSVDDAQNLKMVDVNADGLLDIVYFSRFQPYAMRFRLQKPDYRFGAEIAVPVKTKSTDWEVYNDEGSPLELLTINENAAEVDFQSVKVHSTKVDSNEFLQAHMFHVPTAGKLSSVYTLGDFNGDNLSDIVAADPNGASLYLFLRDKNGSFLPPTQYATYSNVSSLSKVRLQNSEKDALLICSGKEQIVGISTYDGKSFTFPKNIGFSGAVILSAAIDINEDGSEEVVILEQSGRRYKMHVMNLLDDDLTFEVSLGSLQREPTHFLIKDFNNDGSDDVALITPRDYMRVFLRNDDEQFTEFIDESGLLQGQFFDILPSQINVFDYDNDGKDEWVLTKKGYMRSYRIEGDKLTIIGQCNTREEGDDIRGPIQLKSTKEGVEALYAYDLKNLSMQVFSKKEDGVLRYSHMSKIGKIDLQYSIMDEGEDSAALVFGRHSFWYVPMDNQIYSNTVLDSLTSNVEKADFQQIAIGDFNNDSKKDIIAIDGVDGFLEMFTYDEGKSKWQSVLHFKIFESAAPKKSSKVSRFEPREISVADFDNDGKTDIALLCHDKVLVYTQK